MKIGIGRLLAGAIFLGFTGVPPCAAEDLMAKPSLELSFEETEEGLTYAVYGESVISQSKLYPHSVLDISDLPEGAVIVKAFLYWSGELEPRKSADTKVELKNPDGNVATIHAERVWYDYDDLGRCVVKVERPRQKTVYSYDKLSRLIGVTAPSGETTTYTYDAAGNRLTKTVNGVTERSSYNELNQLIAQGNTTYEYDSLGHLVTKREGERGTTYLYDFDGLLEGVVLPEGGFVEYRYDPLGRRIAKRTPEGETRYAYDAEDAHLEFGPENQPTRTYIHGPGIDDLLGTVDVQTKGTSYFLTDRLGSITAVLDEHGQVQSRFTYSPFGEVTRAVRGEPSDKAAHPDPVEGEQLAYFTGRQLDPETMLYYYRSRYYAPGSGRFTTPDPIGLLGGPNLYTYVANNPLNRIDPWGLKEETNDGIDSIDWSGIDQELRRFGLFYNVERIEGTFSINGGPLKTFTADLHGPWITNMSPDMKFTISRHFQIKKPFSKEVFGIPIVGEAAIYFEAGFAVHRDEGGAGVPEPATLALAGIGMAVLGAYYRRRRIVRNVGNT